MVARACCSGVSMGRVVWWVDFSAVGGLGKFIDPSYAANIAIIALNYAAINMWRPLHNSQVL